MTKEKTLAILRQSEGYVSGEDISRALGVSRAAVNAAVQSLRREGYVISSATNRGYCLAAAPDLLTAGELARYLPEERIQSVLCLDTVDSTNRRAQLLAMDGAPDGQTVLANAQTAGRGRLGRAFVSPGGKGVYLSMVLRPACAPADAVSLTAWTAVAIARAVEAACGARPGVKWVNDLTLNGKKICGILTEMAVESESGRIRHVIIGAGLNVSERAEDFPPALAPVATSLLMETGAACPRARLAARVITELDALRRDWPREKARYLSEYRARSVTAGREIAVVTQNGERRGKALQINADFSLAVLFADGAREDLSAGECSVRGLYGYA